ncbi:MAG: hypothetical protein Q7J32_16010 [Sphingomonadaceae bacterium]|nr:hypothetical protein [Sphingomonadaceae bacterium]
MARWKRRIVVFTTLAALVALSGCERPTRDPAKLNSITAEARLLMDAYPSGASVPEARWPPTIAHLDPDFVSLHPDGAYITTKAYFDGGWGYFILRPGQDLPEQTDRFEKIGDGIYWWHPY